MIKAILTNTAASVNRSNRCFTEMKTIYKCPKSSYSRESDVRWRYKHALNGNP